MPRRSESYEEPTRPERDSRWPEEWPDSFLRLCDEMRLARYRDDLAEIQRGELPDNPFFKTFRKEWLGRARHRDGAVLHGNKGAGKSVCALWACMQGCRDGVGGFCFLDLSEFADFWKFEDRPRVGLLKRTPLLVVDEVGDVDDIRGHAFALFKRVINARYRNNQPTILCTTDNEDELRTAIGTEIVDRFPLILGADSESYRGRRA